VLVTLAAVDETAELRIEDEGPGVEPERLDRIFERYFSLRPKTADRGDGPPAQHAGLGLWIVRRNVESLGGRVAASNRIDGGLCIRVTLPCNGTS
jgi:two-component system sensor histidine kinase ChvG